MLTWKSSRQPLMLYCSFQVNMAAFLLRPIHKPPRARVGALHAAPNSGHVKTARYHGNPIGNR
eukprot:8640857-Pyramimonas_sp.AAC.1